MTNSAKGQDTLKGKKMVKDSVETKLLGGGTDGTALSN
jgi:hypothetical protein